MNNKHSKPLRPVMVALGLVMAAGTQASFAAPYQLAPGDTVEIAIGGLPDQRNRAQIQIDGSITLPGVGSVMVAGLTPAELQTRMEALIPTKILRQRLSDGREQAVVVKPGDVVASVVEYRPVYVTGDVLTPGQQAYRASMTVRQAVSVAGGYSLLRSRGQTGELQTDLVSNYQSLSFSYAKEYFHALRINAELRGEERFDQSPPRDFPLPVSTIAPIVQSEAESLKLSLADYGKERVFLENAIKQTDAQFATLRKQQDGEEKGVQADEEELERVVKLFGTGALPSPRVTESRRALLLSSTRRLQTTVELMRLQRQREDFARQLERFASQRTVNLLRELQETTVRMADFRARLEALSQKLQPGGDGATLAGTGNVRPEVTIVRKVGQQWDKIAATEDHEIEPGDVIEAVLRPPPLATASR